MNHADRQRLSQLLTEIEERAANGDDFIDALAEARAIVDHPADPGDAPTVIVNFKGKIGNQEQMRDAVKAAFAKQAPNKTLDAFLSEPIHEYRDRVQTRRRHRALSPLRLTAILTLAAVALVCLTASSQTWGGTERPQTDSDRLATPSRAAQSGYQPTGPTLTAPSAP